MKKEACSAPNSLEAYITKNTPEAIIERYRGLADRVGKANYGYLDDVVVIDVETTGVSFNHDELTQIAAARLQRGKITSWYVSFVNPGKPIPEDISYLTNIFDTDVIDAPRPSVAVEHLAEFVGTTPLVAHNAVFDKHFVTKHDTGKLLAENLWIDSLDLTRIALPRLSSHRLIDLVHAFGAPISTHRADDDVRALCAVYRLLLAAVETMPAELTAYIASCANTKQWETVAVFKYFDEQHRKKAALEESELVLKQDNNGFSDKQNKPYSYSQSSGEVPAGLTNLSLLDLVKHLGSCEQKLRIKSDANILLGEEKNLDTPTKEEIVQAFSSEGLAGTLYEDFEPREEQRIMSEAVADAFAQRSNLVVEAGTGVGKSMAYLIPSVLMAKKNNISVGVATKTNALLDQLINKELPLLKSSWDKANTEPLSYAALKGFAHYPCLRKLQNIVNKGPQSREVQGQEVFQGAALAGLLSYIEQSDYEDIDGLKIDYRAFPRFLYTINSQECIKFKCPFYKKGCLAHGSRCRAHNADIVVTNHSLLFCDVAADGGLLPPVRYWVVDEAHSAESEARRSLSPELSSDKLMALTKLLDIKSPKNIFTRITQELLSSDEKANLLHALNSKAKSEGDEAAQTIVEFTHEVKELLYFVNASGSNKGYETHDLWLNDDIRASSIFAALRQKATLFCNATDKLIKTSAELVSALDGYNKLVALERDLASMVLELKEYSQACTEIILDNSPAYAYAAHLYKKKDRLQDSLQALMVNIGDELNENFYTRTQSVVFASATISIANTFKSFEHALGLNRSAQSQAQSLLLPSSYDFDNQMMVYVLKDMPDPNSPGYIKALESALIGIHKAQKGSVLTLFTNRKDMEAVYKPVQEALKSDNLRVVCQKWGVSVKNLREDFIKNKSLSLMALKSFWEGFDAPGSTLRAVVIPKLPFTKPSDPLSQERGARDRWAWNNYALPQAVIEVKQAAGRLIRKSNDTGVLILADQRLITKGYGDTFLKSLPSQSIRIVSCQELVEILEQQNKLLNHS